MTEDTKERSPSADNALKHGAVRYITTGELPADLEGLDQEIAAEIVRLVGGEDRYRLIAKQAARAMVINELIYRHIVNEHKRYPNKAPSGLKYYGSFQESLRRSLNELGLTPASAARTKPGDEPVNAAQVLDAVNSAKNEQND